MDCLFCAIAAGEVDARQVYSDEHAVAFLDIQPWHAGHTVVIPRRHVADITTDAAALAEIAPAVTAVARTLIGALNADGINVVSNAGEVAGQSVFHLHLHLVPRYADKPGLEGLLDIDTGIDLDEVCAKISAFEG